MREVQAATLGRHIHGCLAALHLVPPSSRRGPLTGTCQARCGGTGSCPAAAALPTLPRCPPQAGPSSHAALTGLWLEQAVQTAVGRIGDVNTEWGFGDRSDSVVMASSSCVKRIVYTQGDTRCPGCTVAHLPLRVCVCGEHRDWMARGPNAGRADAAWGSPYRFVFISHGNCLKEAAKKCRNMTKNIKTGCHHDPHSVRLCPGPAWSLPPGPSLHGPRASDTHAGRAPPGLAPSASHLRPPPLYPLFFMWPGLCHPSGFSSLSDARSPSSCASS